MYVEIIADGRHLPSDLIRLVIKIKGSDRVILCTDSLALAGTNITEGVTLGTEFIIEDGVCKLKDRSAFAGSIATADMLVRTLVKEVGASVEESVKMLTKVPAELLGLNKGILKKGLDADIIVFDDDINLKKIFVMDHHVKEWIVAENTIAHYLSEEPLPQEYVIALAQPVTPNNAKVNVDVKQNEWVLADVTFTGEVRHNHLFFKLHLTATGKKYLYDYRIKGVSKKYYFGICAKWQRNTTDPSVLEAYNVSGKMLFLVPREKEKLEET